MLRAQSIFLGGETPVRVKIMLRARSIFHSGHASRRAARQNYASRTKHLLGGQTPRRAPPRVKIMLRAQSIFLGGQTPPRRAARQNYSSRTKHLSQQAGAAPRRAAPRAKIILRARGIFGAVRPPARWTAVRSGRARRDAEGWGGRVVASDHQQKLCCWSWRASARVAMGRRVRGELFTRGRWSERVARPSRRRARARRHER